MCSCDKKIHKLFVVFVCFVYYDACVASVIQPITVKKIAVKSPTKIDSGYILKSHLDPPEGHKPSIHKLLPSTLKPQLFQILNSSEVDNVSSSEVSIVDDRNISITSSSSSPPPVKKSNHASQIKTLAGKRATAKKKDQSYRPSVIGSILLYLITLIVAGIVFVMLACFMHKWRENMGANTEYPKVEYSMLRQGEDEPEDLMGEILVNIGLALPEDIRPLSETESETDDSKIPSIELSMFNEVSQTLKPEFTTIPLDNEEVVRVLLRPSGDESDEELLQ